jgi:D-alanyl-D-alanine carboxypeptidase
MMTLYIVFEAVKKGEISLDTRVQISKKAAAEPPSKLGLTAGQRIELRYLIRAAAVKSANDAATALAEAVGGTEAAFARRMNRTAAALGMTRTTFKNAHGLTEDGHLSTARDMTILGRHLLYDHPEYYNLFSRRSTDAGLRDVSNTNRRFLDAYKGADGIKTGYTRAAGFNLVASAERGSERIIATVFGGRSTAQRNAQVAELLDLGFARAPSNAAVRKPAAPSYEPETPAPGSAGKTLRLVRAVSQSPRPVPRPETAAEPPEELLVAMAETIEEAITAVQVQPKPKPDGPVVQLAAPAPAPAPDREPEIATAAAPELLTHTPQPRPETLVAEADTPAAEPVRVVVTRISTSGERLWGINVGRYPSRYKAEQVLLRTALTELGSLEDALRKVGSSQKGYDANFLGMTREAADRACRRLAARNMECRTLGPT